MVMLLKDDANPVNKWFDTWQIWCSSFEGNTVPVLLCGCDFTVAAPSGQNQNHCHKFINKANILPTRAHSLCTAVTCRPGESLSELISVIIKERTSLMYTQVFLQTRLKGFSDTNLRTIMPKILFMLPIHCWLYTPCGGEELVAIQIFAN